MRAHKTPGFVDALPRGNRVHADPIAKVGAGADTNVNLGSTMTDGSVGGLINKAGFAKRGRLQTEPVAAKSRRAFLFQV